MVVDVSRPGSIGRPEESSRAHFLFRGQDRDREPREKEKTIHFGWVNVVETTQLNVSAEKRLGYRGDECRRSSVISQEPNQTGLGRQRRLASLYLSLCAIISPPRAEHLWREGQDGIGVTHPSTLHHISSCRMLFSGCSNAQPSAAHASGTLLVVTRRFPSFQEYWDKKSACTSPWQGKNGGREGRRRLARGSCDVGSNQMIR